MINFKDCEIGDVQIKDGQLRAGDKIWMSSCKETIVELESQYEMAFGSVLIGGLGMGVIALLVAQKESVHSVTVFEIDQKVIDLFLSQGFNLSKIQIINQSIYDASGRYDVALFDHYNREDFCKSQAGFQAQLEAELEKLSKGLEFKFADMYLWQEAQSKFFEDSLIRRFMSLTDDRLIELRKRFKRRSIRKISPKMAEAVEKINATSDQL